MSEHSDGNPYVTRFTRHSIHPSFSSIFYSFLFDFREDRRIVYVPFTGDSIRGVTPTEINNHIAFKTDLNSSDLSIAIGMIISLKDHIFTPGMASITDMNTYSLWRSIFEVFQIK
jgi:hypothetical protein